MVPSMNERRPERPTEVRLMRRSWDKNTTFWTLDLNGHRYIVSHLSGGRYHAWIDRDDFAKGIIAFASANHTAPSRESSSGTENEDDCPKRSKDAVAPHTLRSGQAIRRESPSANAATVKVQSPKEYAALPPGGLVERPQRALETRPRNALKTGLRPNFLAPPTRSVALKKKKAPNLSILPSRSASHAVSQRATNSGVISTSRHVSEGETAPSPASNIKLAPLVPGQVHQLEPVLPPPLLPSNARNSVLSNHKRRNTRMAISIEISGQIHPKGSKSLRSCSNIEAFLEVLCNKCHITEASIATVTVRFPWLADRPPRQVIRLDQNVGFVGSLFDEVDNAPCWQEGGTPCCDIHVTVSQKPGWDEDHHQTMLSIFPEP